MNINYDLLNMKTKKNEVNFIIKTIYYNKFIIISNLNNIDE